MACEELLPLESCDLPPKATNGRFENFDKIPPQVGLLVQQCSGRGGFETYAQVGCSLGIVLVMVASIPLGGTRSSTNSP
jgi:hypothetical protein